MFTSRHSQYVFVMASLGIAGLVATLFSLNTSSTSTSTATSKYFDFNFAINKDPPNIPQIAQKLFDELIDSEHCNTHFAAPVSLPTRTCLENSKNSKNAKNSKDEEFVLVAVPFRDRMDHLRLFAHFILNHLDSHRTSHALLIVNQTDPHPFNRGALLNVAALIADSLLHPPTDIILHDVDHLPASDALTYASSPKPIHLASAASKKGYDLPYTSYTGGVAQLPFAVYKQINGHTNNLWGWGGEDDDLGIRLHKNGVSYTRLEPTELGRYECLPHEHSNDQAEGKGEIYDSTRKGGWKTDGMNSLQYDIIEKKVLDAKRLFDTGNLKASRVVLGDGVVVDKMDLKKRKLFMVVDVVLKREPKNKE
ncbi:hypothetical protein HDU79_002885 [Rhizoclosmatium sp. JEL0117]|nr:hypothetical protein HDU79_002885 [Rhizoclosmatium sp. JEL0117]